MWVLCLHVCLHITCVPDHLELELQKEGCELEILTTEPPPAHKVSKDIPEAHSRE